MDSNDEGHIFNDYPDEEESDADSDEDFQCSLAQVDIMNYLSRMTSLIGISHWKALRPMDCTSRIRR